MLTRRHFKAIADIISHVGDPQVHKMLVKQFSDFCRSENAQFDTYRFERACEHQEARPEAVDQYGQ